MKFKWRHPTGLPNAASASGYPAASVPVRRIRLAPARTAARRPEPSRSLQAKASENYRNGHRKKARPQPTYRSSEDDSTHPTTVAEIVQSDASRSDERPRKATRSKQERGRAAERSTSCRKDPGEIREAPGAKAILDGCFRIFKPLTSDIARKIEHKRGRFGQSPRTMLGGGLPSRSRSVRRRDVRNRRAVRYLPVTRETRVSSARRASTFPGRQFVLRKRRNCRRFALSGYPVAATRKAV